jgi:hypothetical protein
LFFRVEAIGGGQPGVGFPHLPAYDLHKHVIIGGIRFMSRAITPVEVAYVISRCKNKMLINMVYEGSNLSR